jgi:hypothetical protein
VPASNELLNIFSSQSGDTDETGTCNTNFQFPTGSPQLNVETGTSLNDCNNPGFLAADVWTGSQGGTFGPYTETPTSTNGGFIPAWQVVIPPAQ